METKLTVRIERKLIEAAKRYAHQRDLSLSKLIEDYLRTIAIQQDEPLIETPLLQKLSGILPSDVTTNDYLRQLEEKYG